MAVFHSALAIYVLLPALMLLVPSSAIGQASRRILQCGSREDCIDSAGTLRISWDLFASSAESEASNSQANPETVPAKSPNLQSTSAPISAPERRSNGGRRSSSLQRWLGTRTKQPKPQTAPSAPNSGGSIGRGPHSDPSVLSSFFETFQPSGRPNQQSKKCSAIPKEIKRYANLVVLSKALVVTGLDKELMDPGQKVTLFAPNDVAFQAMAEKRGEGMDALLKDDKYLRNVLKLHIATEALDKLHMKKSQSVDTHLTGHPVLVTSISGRPIVVPPGGDAANIQLADIHACGSFIHIIDTVLSYIEDGDLGVSAG